MHPWREPGRPVIWTNDGRLVYNDVQERDPVIRYASALLRTLIKSKYVDGYTNDALFHVCVVLNRRTDELKCEQIRD